MRRAAAAPAPRAPRVPVISRRRHRRPKLGLVLGAALAGWATILPVSTPHWPAPIVSTAAPASTPLSAGTAPPADSVIVPVPAAASAAAEQTPDLAATASDATPSRALAAPVAMPAAADLPAARPTLPVAAGLEAATEPPKPLLEDGARPRAQAPPARSPRNPSPAVAHAARRVSPRPHQIVVQLSSYSDQARARQAAEALHRSLHKLLKGAAVRTEAATVRGKPVWRVVAGPVGNREHGRKLCDALRHAGQSCVIIAL